jgi:hypothetical protein
METAWLAWGLLALSLLNLTLLLWLGLTVLLHTRGRDGGAWVIGCGMLAGGGFFLLHAVTSTQGASVLNPVLFARWPLAWAGGFGLPCAWYLAMLWYAGFWKHPGGMRHHRWHQVFLWLLGGVVVLTIGLVTLTSMSWLTAYELPYLLAGPVVGRIPVVILPYVGLLVSCVGMALEALAHPAPSARLMGDLARRRARPWLTAASLALLAVSLCVGGALLHLSPLMAAPTMSYMSPSPAHLQAMASADLLISGMILLAILLLGEGIITYELFSDSLLPHRRLRQSWHTLTGIAVPFCGCVAACLVWGVPPVYGALGGVVLLTTVVAISAWRLHRERESLMVDLRGFIAGPPLFETLLTAAVESSGYARPFQTLCTEVLGARQAYLMPLGPFASLVAPLAHPVGETPGRAALQEVFQQCTTPQLLCLPLASAQLPGLAWAVPLWSSHGLCGLLLLGAPRDNSLYSQEAVEVARIAGERLLDAMASAELAARLMAVQRRRLAESRVTDGRARRTIHDEIMPQVHSAVLTLSAGAEAIPEVMTQLGQLHRDLADLLRAMPFVMSDPTRLGLVGALREVVDGECRDAFDAVEWQVPVEAKALGRTLPPFTAEVLFGAAREAIRNAARYGRGHTPDRPLCLTVSVTCADGLTLTIADDGVGAETHTGPSTGAGQGSVLHGTMMAIVGGTWTRESADGQGTRVILAVPRERCQTMETLAAMVSEP